MRLAVLDPHGYFRSRYRSTFRRHFREHFHEQATRPVTLTFAVGGAGAQRVIGAELLRSLRGRIRRHEIQLVLVAGTRREVAKYFTGQVRSAHLADELGRGVRVLYEGERWAYFRAFTALLRETDVLWTKPSELSFYTGAGIPIIMAPPIGSQEHFNREWLRQVGGGIDQLDPAHADEWLWDWVQSGALARMAWSGYIEAPTHGTYRIESIVNGKSAKLAELEPLPLIA
jgi:hypothetical protein